MGRILFGRGFKQEIIFIFQELCAAFLKSPQTVYIAKEIEKNGSLLPKDSQSNMANDTYSAILT